MTDTRCGTPAGYQAHHRRGEYACADCTQSVTEYARERRRAKGDTGTTLVPLRLIHAAIATADPDTAAELSSLLRHPSNRGGQS